MSNINSTDKLEQKAKINAAISSLGIQIESEDDNSQYCSKTSAVIVRKIVELYGTKIERVDDNDIFTAGIFLFVVSNHISFVMEETFEFISSASVLFCLCPEIRTPQEMSEYVNPIGNLYNAMATNSKITIGIGLQLIKWIDEPTNENFNKLVEWYALCRKHISQR